LAPSTLKNGTNASDRDDSANNGNLYMAIDVGTTKVCTLIAQVAPNGELEIVGTGIQPSLGMRKGLVVDLEEMQDAISQSVDKASRFISPDRALPGACIGVTGTHILSLQSEGSLNNINGGDNKIISHKELAMVVKQSYPKMGPEQELLHVIPQTYKVDSLQGVRNPTGLKGHQLSVKSHIVIGEAASLDNVVRAVEGAGLTVKSMVLEPLGSAEAVLSAEEKQTGVILADIGGGTTDVAIFNNGVMAHTAVIPVGGHQFTNDLVISMGIPYESAEIAKLKYGHAFPESIDPDEMIEVSGYKDEPPHMVRRRDLCRMLNDRGTELLRLILLKVRESGLEVMPPAGVVFTGGGSNIPQWRDLAREEIPGPIRIANPKNVLGLPDALKSPTYSTSVGILLWGIHHPTEQRSYRAKSGKGQFWKGRRWLRWLAQFIGPRT
jgi:cell division protein FtsA